jgi:hypothetical protein
LRNFSRLLAGSLFAIAIFIIFNCAGYLLVTIAGSNAALFAPNTSVSSTSVSTQAEVVAYMTPTATTDMIPALSTPPTTTQLTTPPSPVPLLPTVTLAPPTSTPPESDYTAEPPTATPIPRPDQPSPSTQSSDRATAKTIDEAQLQVLSHRSYVDSLGWYHIVGEVQNNSTVPMEFVEVIARLYDESDKVIGTKLTFTAPDVIFPGGKAAFDVIALRRSQWDRITTYRLEVKGDVSKSLLQENLSLLNQSSYIKDGFLYVAGQVQNKGESPSLVKLIVTLYDAEYNVVNTNWGYADVGVVSPEEISSFEIKIKHQTDPNNYHYRIQVEEEAVETN